MTHCDVLIIGGGAAGLTAAICAARSGTKVAIIEQLPRVGKKILVTGNGRCNLTNLHALHHDYRNYSFAKQALQAYPPEQTIAFFESLGLYTKADEAGRAYPLSNMAASVLECLRQGALRSKVTFICEEKAEIIEKKNTFIVNRHLSADCLILATGGKAAAVHGSDGSGFALAKKMGFQTTDLSPALVQICSDSPFPKQLQGMRITGQANCNHRTVQGEFLFTNYGLSGIAAMDLSRHIKSGDTIELDFFPTLPYEALKSTLYSIAKTRKSDDCVSALMGLMPKALAQVLCKCIQQNLQKPLEREKLSALASMCKRFPLPVSGLNGFDNAQVTNGGLKVNQFNPQTMESVSIPGLYACGEVLDVDGGCGGYNLQWAWSSGQAAGNAAGNKIKSNKEQK